MVTEIHVFGTGGDHGGDCWAAVEEVAEMTIILPSLSSLPEVTTEEAMEEATEGAAGRCLQRLPLGPS